MATYYVSTLGTDANTGLQPTQGTGTAGPWLTLAKAFGALNSGDTCYILAGTYGGATLTRSGHTYENYQGALVIITNPVADNRTVIVDCQSVTAATFRGLTFKQPNASIDKTAGLRFLTCTSGSATSWPYLVDACTFVDCEKDGVFIERSNNVEVRGCDISNVAVGIHSYCPATSAQLYGRGHWFHDNNFHDINKMVRNTGASSDFGAEAIGLDRSGGDPANPTIIEDNTAHDLYAARVTNPSNQKYDGSFIEFYGNSDTIVRRNKVWDVKNFIECGSEAYGTGHSQATTLAAAVAIGATSAKLTAIPSLLQVGDYFALDSTSAPPSGGGIAETVVVKTIGTAGSAGTGITFERLSDTANQGAAYAHALNAAATARIPISRNTVVGNLCYRGAAIAADANLSGYVRGFLLLGMTDSYLVNNTFVDLDQFSVACPTPVGNDFPTPLYNTKVSNNIFVSPGGNDAEGTLRRVVTLLRKDYDSIFDNNLYFSRTSQSIMQARLLTGTGNQELLDIAAIQANTSPSQEANGIEANPLFVNESQYDFTLTGGSPARNRASSVPGVNDGRTDLGAYDTVVVVHLDPMGARGFFG